MEPDRHILVLGDQLTRRVGPLAGADPERTRVLMIESRALAERLPHHRQKLILVFSAMRHFARELEDDGFAVHYVELSSDRRHDFGDGVAEYMDAHGPVTLTLMSPSDRGYAEAIREACEAAGGGLELVANELWLTDDATFDAWAEGRTELRMEWFYRRVRAERGWLMDGDEPAGGAWNHDRDNRETPEAGHAFPGAAGFEPDGITEAVIALVEREFPDRFGAARPFRWPVTRAQAEAVLEDFCANRLRRFGPFEDAMVTGEAVLYHSLLSVPLNLGLLHPEEVIETALEYAADGRRKIPVNSIEGFVRQILGWREFVRHVYRTHPDMASSNELGHELPLPELYWSGETGMNCLHQVTTQVIETGHAHHIQRLMVLGTFAQIAGVDPRELLDWFTAAFVDALEWVMVPNVIGMSQYADGGGFTSKPYAASANYIDKMSDYCGGCRYAKTKKLGDDACPFNSLYWDFIDRHLERWEGNARMNMVRASWQRRDEESKEEIRRQAARVKERLREGRL